MNSRVKKQNSFSRCNHKGDLERKRKQLWFLLRYTHKQKFISMYSRQQKRHQLMPYTQHRMIKLKSQDGFHVFQHFHKMTPFPLYTNPRRYTHQFISFFYGKNVFFSVLCSDRLTASLVGLSDRQPSIKRRIGLVMSYCSDHLQI